MSVRQSTRRAAAKTASKRASATKTKDTTPLLLRRLRTRLREVGYTKEKLAQLLRAESLDDIGILNHAPALDDSLAATATRLLFLEADEPRANVAALFPRAELADLARIGVFYFRGHGKNASVRARLRIDPVGDHYVLADRRFRDHDARALQLRGREPVYPASSDSLLLRDAALAPEKAEVLDLCAGSGVQALHHAPQARRVIAVDINPRAVALARRNAEMNGLDNVEVRAGDLYAAVPRQRFDLIVANPPFVTSPYAFGPAYHAPRTSTDRILRRIVDGWRTHLNDGGRGYAIAHLALRNGDDTETVTARWFRNFPGRVLVLVLETGTAIDLAAAQSLFALDRGLSAYAAEVSKWVTYLHRRRITEVKLVLLAVERGKRRSFDVVDAHPRVLPMPLTPPPAQRIHTWIQK
jgi:carbamoyltransferase